MKKLLIALVVLQPLLAVGQPFLAKDEGYFESRAGNVKVLVFVSGLVGEGTWDYFKERMEADPRFSRYDKFFYHTPEDQKIDSHVEKLTAISAYIHSRSYQEVIYVAHSMGGILTKKALLERVAAGDGSPPSFLITYGTPYKEDEYKVKLLRWLASGFNYFFLSDLKKELLKEDGAAMINREWRQFLQQQPTWKTHFLSVFGLNDGTAPSQFEDSAVNETVFIRGDHRAIVLSKQKASCSFQILQEKAEDPTDDLSGVGCLETGINNS